MSGRRAGIWRGLLGLWLGLLSFSAHAHKVSDSYLRLEWNGARLQGQWSLALHDLELAVGLDANEDGAITWGELKARREAIVAYARKQLQIETDTGALAVEFGPELQVENLLNGTYAVLTLSATASAAPSALTLEYHAFFEDNPLHRGLLRLSTPDGVRQSVFHPLETRRRFEASPSGGAMVTGWGGFWFEGVRHIGLGYDHLLFLLVLLLPAVLQREADGWSPVRSPGVGVREVVKVVTAFTVAHSVTLSLAVLNVVQVPARFVEPAIAASILVAAGHNLVRREVGRSWMVAFAFGLIHGFGFSSALADLGLPTEGLVGALVGFNLGVEAGQLAVVLVVLPLLFGWSRRRGYVRWGLRAGSWIAAAIAAVWFVERVRGG